jgi:hypothetical protein
MSVDRFERQIGLALADLAAPRTPDYFEVALERAVARRQRPAWTFAGRWLPSRFGWRAVEGRESMFPNGLRPVARSPLLILLLVGLLLGLALALVTVGSWLPNLLNVLRPLPGGAFVPTGSMVDASCYECQAVVLKDGRVLVVGGYPGPDEDGVAQIYDPATWTFAATGRLSRVHPEAAVLLDDGRVLVAGQGISPAIEIYDPATGTFRLIEHQFEVGTEAALLADGRVLMIGWGEGTGSAVTFDPRTEAFTPVGPRTASLVLAAKLVPLGDGRILVVTDSESGGAEIFDPSSNSFSATGSMNRARGAFFTATALDDGRVLIVGGVSDGQTLASAEVFDPATGTFTLTGAMEMPRSEHAAARLPDGRVLVVGGSSDAGRVDAGTFSEIYDPQTGRFTRGPVTNQPRLQATAVSLPSGVLVLGHYPGDGIGGNEAAGRTAELFTLAPVERPADCCLDNPGFISVSATAQRPGAWPVTLVVPAGALEGAVGASGYSTFTLADGGSAGRGGDVTLSSCSEGCRRTVLYEVPTRRSGGPFPQDFMLTVTVEITYQGPPPPQASGIEVVIEEGGVNP